MNHELVRQMTILSALCCLADDIGLEHETVLTEEEAEKVQEITDSMDDIVTDSKEAVNLIIEMIRLQVKEVIRFYGLPQAKD